MESTEIPEKKLADILGEDPVPFSRFMETVLYHPSLGYYERAGRIGCTGDFITGVSVGEVFGVLLCERLAGWARERGLLHWVEAGAHEGHLARDILDHCRREHASIYRRLRYGILEPSGKRRKRQEERLRDHAGRVVWHAAQEELGEGEFPGVIFANELLDALPVERVFWSRERREWRLWGVRVAGGCPAWRPMPGSLAGEALGPLGRLPPECLDRLADGFTTERHLAAEEWWRRAARCLGGGILMTLDYGLTTGEFLVPHRARGTLRAYRDHRQSEDVLAHPGEQDLTCHVDFSALVAAGESEGLRTLELDWQERFLTRIMEGIVREGRADALLDPQRLRQFRTLVHPEGFGRSFRVLVQERG